MEVTEDLHLHIEKACCVLEKLVQNGQLYESCPGKTIGL